MKINAKIIKIINKINFQNTNKLNFNFPLSSINKI